MKKLFLIMAVVMFVGSTDAHADSWLRKLWVSFFTGSNTESISRIDVSSATATAISASVEDTTVYRRGIAILNDSGNSTYTVYRATWAITSADDGYDIEDGKEWVDSGATCYQGAIYILGYPGVGTCAVKVSEKTTQ